MHFVKVIFETVYNLKNKGLIITEKIRCEACLFLNYTVSFGFANIVIGSRVGILAYSSCSRSALYSVQ